LGLDIGQLTQVFAVATDGKLNLCPLIGTPDVRIPNIGGEELNEAPRTSLSGANSFGSTGAPEAILRTSRAIIVPYRPIAHDNVFYHSLSGSREKGHSIAPGKPATRFRSIPGRLLP
jgi:hypothetical protein